MEKSILNCFLTNNRLKFSEIEKLVKSRSNKLSYHIKNLVKKGTLKKEDEYYSLSNKSEELIPYISDKKANLAVILIAIKKNNNQIYLIKRNKRPFKEKLSLPGGRILVGESISKATKRITKKWQCNCELEKINSVTLEHVTKENKLVHSFFLFLVTAKTNQKLDYTNLNKNKEKIISSDYKLLKNDLKKVLDLDEVFTEG